MRVIAHPSSEILSIGAAARIAEALASAPGPRASLGLAGGSTPRAVYERLRANRIEWGAVDVWLSDERWVPADHEESNGRMAVESLVAHIDAELLRPRWSEYLTPADSAAFYEADLRRIMPDGVSDVVLLGMGADGHTASLFPGTEALAETARWFIHNEVPQLDTWRLTATAPMIQRARNVFVLVSGESKAGVLTEVLEGPDGVHPIQLLAHAAGDVVWLVDEAAAAGLTITTVERP